MVLQEYTIISRILNMKFDNYGFLIGIYYDCVFIWKTFNMKFINRYLL